MVAHQCDEKELIGLLLIKTQQSTPYIVDQLSVSVTSYLIKLNLYKPMEQVIKW